jgi:hypothetical protein
MPTWLEEDSEVVASNIALYYEVSNSFKDACRNYPQMDQVVLLKLVLSSYDSTREWFNFMNAEYMMATLGIQLPPVSDK